MRTDPLRLKTKYQRSVWEERKITQQQWWEASGFKDITYGATAKRSSNYQRGASISYWWIKHLILQESHVFNISKPTSPCYTWIQEYINTESLYKELNGHVENNLRGQLQNNCTSQPQEWHPPRRDDFHHSLFFKWNPHNKQEMTVIRHRFTYPYFQDLEQWYQNVI